VGRSVLLLGGLGSADAVRFGGTQYAKVVLNKMWGLPPALDMDYEKRVQAAIREIVNAGLAESAHDVGEGGLAVALAECSAAGVGARIALATDLRPEFALFHEGPSRILISTEDPLAVQAVAKAHNVSCVPIGETTENELRIMNEDLTASGLTTESFTGETTYWIQCPTSKLREVWDGALENQLTSFAHK